MANVNGKITDNTVVDPWLTNASHSERLPDDVVFACAYDLHIVIDYITEACFFRRTETLDELWVIMDIPDFMVRQFASGAGAAHDSGPGYVKHTGCAYAVPKKDEEKVACLNLLERFLRARIGSYWPNGFVAPGIIDRRDFDNLVMSIERELKANTEKAREAETEIIQVARELGLCPEPTGKGPDAWQARCPGTNHPIYISASENQFGCGWCKRKGGPDELREFCEERKKG